MIRLFILPTFLALLICPHVANSQDIEAAGPAWRLHIVDGSSHGADGVKLADINGDGRLDIATGWEEGGLTRVYLHPGHDQVKTEWPAVTVGETPGAEDAVFVDLDADGAADVVTCTERGTKTVFVHWSPTDRGDLLDPAKWEQAPIPASQDKMQWMFAWPMQLDGKHGIDLIAGGKGPGAQIGWFQAPSNARDLSAYRWRPISDAGWVMSLWQRDMDGDGDLDIVTSDRYGSLRGCRWLENPGPGAAQTKPWENHFMGATDKEVLSMTMADLDGDGFEDALVAVKDYKVLYLRRLDATGRKWETHEISADFNAGNTRAVAVGDLNGDERPDLALTTWLSAGKHGVLWLEYEDSPTDRIWNAHQISGVELGLKYDRIELLDLDGDGDLDLLTCEENEGGEGLGVIWYENPSENR